jgi:hypothetical protein
MGSWDVFTDVYTLGKDESVKLTLSLSDYDYEGTGVGIINIDPPPDEFAHVNVDVWGRVYNSSGNLVTEDFENVYASLGQTYGFTQDLFDDFNGGVLSGSVTVEIKVTNNGSLHVKVQAGSYIVGPSTAPPSGNP